MAGDPLWDDPDAVRAVFPGTVLHPELTSSSVSGMLMAPFRSPEQVACRELRRRFGLMTFLMHPGIPVDQGGRSPAGEAGMGVHGGRNETSVMLHLRPDLVRMDLAVRSVPERLSRFSHIGSGKQVSFGWLSGDFGAGGVIGDPTGATPELGKASFEAGVSRCAAALREVARFAPA